MLYLSIVEKDLAQNLNFASFPLQATAQVPCFMFSKTYDVSARANDRHQRHNQNLRKRLSCPLWEEFFFRNIIKCTKPCLNLFIQKVGLIIADSCLKSQDFENKVAEAVS